MPDSNGGQPVDPVLKAILEELAEQREHRTANRAGRDDALKSILTSIVAKMERVEAKVEAAPKSAPDPMPAWAKAVMGFGGLVVLLVTIGGFLVAYGRSDQATVARITAIETAMETARRIRDQQQQAMLDRMRSLELSDQTGSERMQAVLQQLATITAQLQAQGSRVEELLRRQDRLENRLGARPGSGPLSEQPTTLTLPLRWSVQ
jgi:hypothetical protein